MKNYWVYFAPVFGRKYTQYLSRSAPTPGHPPATAVEGLSYWEYFRPNTGAKYTQ